MTRKIAVAGATGNVGREILAILAERNFPATEVVALASRNSVGREVSYGEKVLTVKALEDYDFKGTKIALFSPGGSVSAIHVLKDGNPVRAGSGDSVSFREFRALRVESVFLDLGCNLSRGCFRGRADCVSRSESVIGLVREIKEAGWWRPP